MSPVIKLRHQQLQFAVVPDIVAVPGDHVEGVVPFAIAASRYVHVFFKSSPHLNGVGVA